MVPVGSGFGFRTDPFTGRAALHTGLDFPADPARRSWPRPVAWW
jgi:murein DD-endopeptidase MepM/ murein hydrolase activator NlpD